MSYFFVSDLYFAKYSFSVNNSSTVSDLYNYPISSRSQRPRDCYTKNVMIVLGTVSFKFFLTTLKYDTMSSLIISVSL
jgi:hypothetical protein